MRFIQILYFTSALCTIIHSQDCNPLVCLHYFQNLYNSKNYREICTKLKKIENCLNHCSFPGVNGNTFVNKGLSSLKEEVCMDDWRDIEQMSQCFNDYKYRLLFCTYAALQVNPVNTSTDFNLLTCGRIHKAQQCPESIMEPCPSSVKEEALNLIVKFFDPVREEVCNLFSFSDAWNLELFENDKNIRRYQKLMKCLDLHHEAVSKCIPQKLTTNFLVTGHYRREICSGVHNFTSCAVNIISAKCDEQTADVLRELLYTLRMSLLQCCTVTEEQVTTISSGPVFDTTVTEEQVTTINSGPVFDTTVTEEQVITISSGPVFDTTVAVTSHNTVLPEQVTEVPSDAKEELPKKQAAIQRQNWSNHSTSEFELYIIHINPKIKDQESGSDFLSSSSALHIVIFLILFGFDSLVEYLLFDL